MQDKLFSLSSTPIGLEDLQQAVIHPSTNGGDYTRELVHGEIAILSARFRAESTDYRLRKRVFSKI